MKTTRILRLLSVIGFLLLLSPFYDSCNGQRLKQVAATDTVSADTTVVTVDSVTIDTAQISKIEIDTVGNSAKRQESVFDQAYEFIDDDDSENAFEFAKTNIDSISDFDYKGLKKEYGKEGSEILFFQLKNLCFSFIVLITSVILFLSFSKKANWISRLAIANLILLAVTLICIFTEGTFENFAQIKWGYYLFILTNILIFHYSKTNKIKT